MENFDLLRFEIIDLTELVDDGASRSTSRKTTGCSWLGGKCHGSNCGCKPFNGTCGSPKPPVKS